MCNALPPFPGCTELSFLSSQYAGIEPIDRINTEVRSGLCSGLRAGLSRMMGCGAER